MSDIGWLLLALAVVVIIWGIYNALGIAEGDEDLEVKPPDERDDYKGEERRKHGR